MTTATGDDSRGLEIIFLKFSKIFNPFFVPAKVKKLNFAMNSEKKEKISRNFYFPSYAAPAVTVASRFVQKFTSVERSDLPQRANLYESP